MNADIFIQGLKQKSLACTKEEVIFGSMSIDQINQLLKAKITEVHFRCSFTSSMRSNRHYIVWFRGPDEEKSEIIAGKYFFNFSVKIPSVPKLKEMVTESGVPWLDHVAYAIELEKLFQREMARARSRIRQYHWYLDNLHDPKDVPRRVLFDIYTRVLKKYHHRKRLSDFSCSESEANLHREIACEMSAQLKVLNTYLL